MANHLIFKLILFWLTTTAAAAATTTTTTATAVATGLWFWNVESLRFGTTEFDI